jgi:hypothetical protein
MPSFDCELILRENDYESHEWHSFIDEVRPGTIVHVQERDWVIIEVRGYNTPEVICRPVYERR